MSSFNSINKNVMYGKKPARSEHEVTYADVTSTANDFNTSIQLSNQLDGSIASLESIYDQMKSSLTNGGLDRTSVDFVEVSLRHATAKFGMYNSTASNESVHAGGVVATEISMERVKELLGKFVKGVKAVALAIWRKLVEHFEALMSFLGISGKRVQAMGDKSDAINKLIKELENSGTSDTDKSAIEGRKNTLRAAFYDANPTAANKKVLTTGIDSRSTRPTIKLSSKDIGMLRMGGHVIKAPVYSKSILFSSNTIAEMCSHHHDRQQLITDLINTDTGSGKAIELISMVKWVGYQFDCFRELSKKHQSMLGSFIVLGAEKQWHLTQKQFNQLPNYVMIKYGTEGDGNDALTAAEGFTLEEISDLSTKLFLDCSKLEHSYTKFSSSIKKTVSRKLESLDDTLASDQKLINALKTYMSITAGYTRLRQYHIQLITLFNSIARQSLNKFNPDNVQAEINDKVVKPFNE